MSTIPIMEEEDILLAHLLAMHDEAADRFTDLADCLYQHHNVAAHTVFDQALQLQKQAIAQLEDEIGTRQLPTIAPWEYLGHCEEHPECECMQQAHYLMSAQQAVQLALFIENRLLTFCQHQQQAKNSATRDLASNQTAAIRQRIQQLSVLADQAQDKLPLEDFDPPNMPE